MAIRLAQSDQQARIAKGTGHDSRPHIVSSGIALHHDRLRLQPTLVGIAGPRDAKAYG